MDLKRSSLRGLFNLLATIAISMAASLSGTLKSFTSPAEPGAAAARTGFGAGAGGSGSRSLGRFGLLVLRDGKFALDEDNNHQRDESHKNNRVAEQRNQSGSADLEVNHSLIYQKHTGHLSYASTIEYLQMFSSFALRSVRNFMV